MKKYLISGKDGMLASAFISDKRFNNHIALNHSQFDLTDYNKMIEVVEKYCPSYIINCAAFTDVTKAEANPEEAFMSNVKGVENLAKISREKKIFLVHFSSDYVFPGDIKKDSYENDKTDPVNIYGRTKDQGEKKIQSILDDFLIIRISWLYGPKGKNFVSNIAELLRKKEELGIVSDQFGKTTYSLDVVEAVSSLITKKKTGIYHFANHGVCSRYDFTQKILEILNKFENITCKIKPISAKDYQDNTPRPSYSVLNTKKIEIELNYTIPHWHDSLKKYLYLNV